MKNRFDRWTPFFARNHKRVLEHAGDGGIIRRVVIQQRKHCADAYYRSNLRQFHARPPAAPSGTALRTQPVCQNCQIGRAAAARVLQALADAGVPDRYYCLLCFEILRKAMRGPYKMRTGLSWGATMIALKLLRADQLVMRKGATGDLITERGRQVYEALRGVYEGEQGVPAQQQG